MRDFGDYECLTQVARGSTGIVWRARHRELDRVVAVKELSPELRDRPGFLDGFRAEARHLATLDDPHVIRLFDYVEEPERAWMAEEWVDGAPLSQVLSAAGPLTAEQSLGVLRGVLMGLAAAHAMRLVHGDVAPSNVLVDADGTAKLVDFGLAAPAGLPADPELLGTPAYLSPETIARHSRDPRSDVYSAAAVLVQMLTGRPPYSGGTVADVLRQHVEAPVPGLDELAAPLRRLLRRALAKDPDDRPADARSFLEELEAAAREEHGAGWLERSSIAPAVGALIVGGLGGATGGVMAGTVMGAVTGAGVSAAGSTGAASASVTASAISTGTATTAAGASTSSSSLATQAAATAAKSGSRKLLYVAGGGATVAVAAVAAVILASGGAEAVQIAGEYGYESRIVRADNARAPTGSVFQTASWTLPPCDAPCSGTIASSSGKSKDFTFDGTTLRSRQTLFTPNAPCGAPGGTGDLQSTFELTLRPDRGEGAVQAWTGTEEQTVVATRVSGNCVIGPPKRATLSLALTRKG